MNQANTASKSLLAPDRLAQLRGALQWTSLSKQGAYIIQNLLVPLIAIALCLGLWGAAAKNIQTSLGALPGPAQVWEQAVSLLDEHQRRTRQGRRVLRTPGRTQRTEAGRGSRRRGS